MTKKMEEKTFGVTINAEDGGSLFYTMYYKTKKGAIGAGKRIANQAFYGQKVEIIAEEIKTT